MSVILRGSALEKNRPVDGDYRYAAARPGGVIERRSPVITRGRHCNVPYVAGKKYIVVHEIHDSPPSLRRLPVAACHAG